MSSFYFALLAVLITGLGARDQLTVANLTLRQGARPMVLAIGIVLSLATAAFAAAAADYIAPQLVPRARTILAAIALLLTGGELVLITPGRRPPREPTRSLIAAGVLLAFHQLTDAARFLIFAVGVATNAPIPAGMGGALGGIVVLAAAWFFPAPLVHPRVRHARRWLGTAMVLLGLVLGGQAMGFI